MIRLRADRSRCAGQAQLRPLAPRIAETLEALFVEQHGKAPSDGRFADFLQTKQEIDQVKDAGAAARIERFKKDLELLKAKNPPEYEGLRDELRRVLKG